MNIFWHGQSCFEIIISPAKNNHLRASLAIGNSGGHIQVVIDPFSEDLGLKLPKLGADILLVSHNHPDHNNIKAVGASLNGSQPFLISDPGEYEVKNVFVQGIPSWHDNSQGKERGQNIIYTIEAEDLKLCHLGDLGQKELTESQLEQIGDVDVLMIPIGGNFTISAKEALKIMSQIEPKITIPMHYALPKLKTKLDELDKFLKQMGIKKIEPFNKLTIKKKDILPEEAKIVVLKP